MAQHGIHQSICLWSIFTLLKTLSQTNDYDVLIENIDIGGPAMLRAASKNHDFLTVLCDPADYGSVADAITTNGGTDLVLRRHLAANVLPVPPRTIVRSPAGWLPALVSLPPMTSLPGHKILDLRYGENPHQKAALYKGGKNRPGVTSALQIQGKPLSYNNINDTDAAFELVAEFDQPTIAIIKHANPCGVASADVLHRAWRNALAADPVSAFGGIVAMNQPLDIETANAVSGIFAEVVIAPDASDDAKTVMKAIPNLRLLITREMPDRATNTIKIQSVAGGFLAQSRIQDDQ